MAYEGKVHYGQEQSWNKRRTGLEQRHMQSEFDGEFENKSTLQLMSTLGSAQLGHTMYSTHANTHIKLRM